MKTFVIDRHTPLEKAVENAKKKDMPSDVTEAVKPEKPLDKEVPAEAAAVQTELEEKDETR